MKFFKEIKQEAQSLDTSKKRLRHFGIVVGSIFIAIAVVIFIFSGNTSTFIGAVGASLVLLGIILPPILLVAYISWMMLAIVLGALVGGVVLTVLFYLVVTPIGILTRLIKGDLLHREIDIQKESYWITRESGAMDSQRMEKMF